MKYKFVIMGEFLEEISQNCIDDKDVIEKLLKYCKGEVNKEELMDSFK